ncbi:MAG: hypothetical protein LUG99_14295 [Lachnospiraceae bacterium]|nr:hypothetical protein [Lachnospiraceae bacterium]
MYWNYNQEEKKKNILFLSVDDEHGNEFGSMLGGDPPYALRQLCEKCYADLVLLCSSAKLKQQFEDDTAREWLENVYMDRYFSCALDVTEQKEEKIREYLDGLDYEEYAIIDYEELEPVFPGHTVYLPDLFNDSAVRKAERILRYGSYANKLHRYEPRGSMGDFIEDNIAKAIFLDIDGVLNDDGERRDKGEIICPEYVENLAWIVKETDAEIILSFSWRYGMIHEDSGKNDVSIQTLLDEFGKYHLRIAGMTPLYFNGPDGRPYEVRTWLAFRPDLEGFVILDDEPFWKWNWLSNRVVNTARKPADADKVRWWDYEKGLDRDFARQAVEILNQ